MRESSWSAQQNDRQIESLVTTYVKGAMRRVESEIGSGMSDSARQAAAFAQIDRLDRDSSYYIRPGIASYIVLPLATVRESNSRRARAFAEARRKGTAPRDTIPGVRTAELGRTKSILGEPCRAVLVELVFDVPDTAGSDDRMTGVLSDTLWLAGKGSPAAELKRFERDFAHATKADSFLASASAIQLAMSRGQGLVSVIQRAIRNLDGYALEENFVNLLHGLPPGMQGFERMPDGAVVVQRTRRVATGLSNAPVDSATFAPPAGFKRVEQAAAPSPPRR